MKKSKDQQGSEEDKKLWQTITQGVKPYIPKAPHVPIEKKTIKRLRRLPVEPEIMEHPSKGAYKQPNSARNKQNEPPPDGRLDLHGMTEEKAFSALNRFIEASVRQHRRKLLVITGKGKGSEGVLRRIVPLWLEEASMNKHILTVSPASINDGGEGALIVKLKKPR